MIEAIKVVTAQEMARLEKKAIAQGASAEEFMREAGRKIAAATLAFIEKHSFPKKVTLLVGKGNNGGDAYAAGIHLLDEGVEVHAYPPLSGSVSPLHRQFGLEFQKRRGQIQKKLEGVLLDGLFGTGLRGPVDPESVALIRQANASGLPLLAIDIPSGLNGSTGEVQGEAILAQETIALGLPKMGFFLRQGWNHVGILRLVDFGLSSEILAEAEPLAFLPKHIPLPPLVRNRHKYQAGSVIGYGSSKAFAGAAKLSSLAALKGGAGLVHLFSPEEIGPVPLELISTRWTRPSWQEALSKARAVFVGPGLGRKAAVTQWLKRNLPKISLPCVIDADALLPNIPLPKEAILTPHRGEMLRLLGLKEAPQEEVFFAQIMKFCERKKVVLVLKGAPTFLFRPQALPVIVPHGDPGMATAGSGDVLTGLIAALLAQGVKLGEAAVLGVTLHALAGEAAASEKTSYCVVATDLIDFFPAAFKRVQGNYDLRNK